MNETPVTFIWPGMSHLSDDRLTFRATGYDQDGSHWTGEKTILLAEPSYRFWTWVYLNRWLWPPIMSETLLSKLEIFFTEKVQSNEQTLLQVPQDANLIYLDQLQPGAALIIDQLFNKFGIDTFTDLSISSSTELTKDALRSLCAGLVEVFCYRGGKCDFFCAFAETSDAFDLNAKILAKRLKKKKGTGTQQP